MVGRKAGSDMITNKKTARKVEKTMRTCSAALNQSVRLVMDTCSEREFKAYRKVIGQIMGAIYVDVMWPIHRRFPDLEPEALKK
jgi:hypothetical protein